MKLYLGWPAIIGWLLLLMVMETQATLTASLDRYQINEGETIQLTIEASGQISITPSTEPLTKDFDVMGVISGSRVNIINGQVDARTTWTISLVPKQSGELTIPSLDINGEQTPVLVLQVNQASASSADAAPVLIETTIDKKNPYVQEMVLYTVRVFYTINLAQASLSDPQAENMLVHAIDEDRNYTDIRNGTAYQVVEREYAVFPQTSGEFVLSAPILNAQIPNDNSQSNSLFDSFFTATRPIRLRGDPYTITVQPRPDQSVSPYWLPAEAVELTESWQPSQEDFSVNEPVTRTITIRATAMAGDQLPDLQIPEIEGFKIYPDRAQANTYNLPQNIEGEKTLRITYVPTQAGEYTLPAVKLNWWDTKTNQQQIATLAEHVIEVKPLENTQQVDAALLNELIQHKETIASSNESTLSSALPADPKSLSNGTHVAWFWASLIFAALWLLTLGLWWRNHYSAIAQPENKPQPFEDVSIRKTRKYFLSACNNNNPHLARQYLLQWAAKHWPQSPPTGLNDLAERLDNRVAINMLVALDQTLYKKEDDNWDGYKLTKVINKLPKQQSKSNKKIVLPGLYR